MTLPSGSPSPLTLPERDAAALAWVRTHEAGPLPPWTPEDGDAVTREARRVVGASASAESFLAERARLGAERLAQRGAPLPPRLVHPSPWPIIAFVTLALSLAVGWGVGTVGPQGRINILAPPLLALALWNLVVYLLIGLQSLRRARSMSPVPLAGVRGGLVALAARGAQRVSRATGRPTHGPLRRFLADWARTTAPLQAMRASALLHLAAATLALAALAALYARGLAFEYRAGWDSTFLSADSVHTLLSAVLGPASTLSGLPLPDAATLESLRFSRGGGENAARWIHLHAITLGGIVVVPRLLLGMWAMANARRLGRHVPVPDGADLRRLRQAHRGVAVHLRVHPFSYGPSAEVRAGLREWLAHEHGEVIVDWSESATDMQVQSGSADKVPTLHVALFALTATPERETHGVFLQELNAATRGAPPIVLIDESGFRRRFSGASGEQRLQQRREAWRRLLADLGMEGRFADLAARHPEAA